jgi:hypothetical protein
MEISITPTGFFMNRRGTEREGHGGIDRVLVCGHKHHGREDESLVNSSDDERISTLRKVSMS